MKPRTSAWTDSFANALRGIAYGLRHERHLRFHFAATAAVAAAGIWLRIAAEGWLWLAAATASVWTAELLNTAVERAVDLASPAPHPLARAAKDTAAAAVLVTAAFAAVVGLIVLGPPLWRTFIE